MRETEKQIEKHNSKISAKIFVARSAMRIPDLSFAKVREDFPEVVTAKFRIIR